MCVGGVCGVHALAVVCVLRSTDSLRDQFSHSIMTGHEIKPRLSELVGSVLAGPPFSSWQVSEVPPLFSPSSDDRQQSLPLWQPCSAIFPCVTGEIRVPAFQFLD